MPCIGSTKMGRRQKGDTHLGIRMVSNSDYARRPQHWRSYSVPGTVQSNFMWILLYNTIALGKASHFLTSVLTKLLRHKARPTPDSRSSIVPYCPPRSHLHFQQHCFNLPQEWSSKAMWHIRMYFAFKWRFALNAAFKLIIYKWDYIWKTSSCLLMGFNDKHLVIPL